MGIQLNTTRSSWTGDIIRERKQDAGTRIRLDDLPFGQGGGRRWRQEYIPSLIAWAGSQDDPFAINHSVREEMVKIWECVFPSCQLRDNNLNNLEKMVCYLCRDYTTRSDHFQAVNALNNWRSDLGKQGYNTVRELFNSDSISFGTIKDREGYVLDALDQKRYLFKHPDMEGDVSASYLQ